MRGNPLLIATVALLALGMVLGGCGGSSDGPADPGNGQPDPDPPGTTGTVEGTVYMPDGVTPAPSTFVGVPVAEQAVGMVPRQTPEDIDEDQWVVYTFSDADGSFSLPGVPVGQTTLVIIKGQWSRTLQVSVAANETTTLTSEEGTLPSTPDEGAPNIAVVTGAWDRMEDVLAKIGLGNVDGTGHLIPGTEQFDIYDDAEDLFTDASLLNSYNIVFVNCGAREDLANLPAVQQNLQDFVSQGGVLYLTDLTYPYVEHAFPGRVEFLGGVGQEDITTDAEVLSDDSVGQYFKNWLSNRNVLNPDGTVHIDGFAPGWAVIDSVDANVRVWIRGEVSYHDYSWMTGAESSDATAADAASGRCCHRHSVSPSLLEDPETAVKPLTVSFAHGAGRVLFTSYHTVHDDPRPELHPQEVVLAGLVFEM